MTRIGVLSDTHLPRLPPELSQRLAQAWGPVDMILHAGDLTSLEVLGGLPPAQVVAVHGNMDQRQVAINLPASLVLTVEGHKLGLTHGSGAPMGLAGRVRRLLGPLDCIVFGHSHRPANLVMEGTLMFNPGSTGRGFIGSGTVGLLTLEEGKPIKGQIIKL